MRSPYRFPAIGLVLCLLLSDFSTSLAQTRGPDPRAALTALEARLAALERSKADSTQIEKLPAWLLGYSAIGWSQDLVDLAELDRARTGLKAILAGEASARIKALAVMWLTAGRDVRDLEALEALIDSQAPAGSFPSIHVTQIVQPSYPVSWNPKDLGSVALAGLSALTGQAFHDPAAYRAWRQKNPDLRTSCAYWQGLLPHARPELRQSWLDALRRDEPALYLRVLLMQPGAIDLGGQDEERLIGLVMETLGKAGLVALLAERTPWPEAAEPARHATFSAWIFDRAERFFQAEDVPTLLSIWERTDYGEQQPHARVALALATSRLSPAHARRVLTATLDRISYGQGPLLERLARLHCPDELASLRRWFFESRPGDRSGLRRAIFAGLAEAGPRALACLEPLVLDRRLGAEEPEVIEALANTCLRLHPGLRLPRRAEIHAKGTGPWAKRKMRWRAVTPADEKRALRARRDCLRRIRAWLRTARRP
ncbi:MAG: hypothetical protein JXR96_25075 [Deltaproteobacteria bacterium]|nr:hypothetical protein [Deltaproteobacteria bacterium]